MDRAILARGFRDNLAGRIYHYWLVLYFSHRVGKRGYWVCQCRCGTIRPVWSGALQNHRSRSCGCFRDELVATRSTKHGGADSPEYHIWQAMKSRCQNPRNSRYHRYGGRGIAVCDRWLDFANFLADMGQRPSLQHSLERVKNHLGYSPENCTWATAKVQQRNRDCCVRLYYNGQTLLLQEWAEQLGIHVNTLRGRLSLGWSVADALTLPVRHWPKGHNPSGSPACKAVWQAVKSGKLVKPDRCSRAGCTESIVQAHHHRGYDRKYWLDVVWLCQKHHSQSEREGVARGPC